MCENKTNELRKERIKVYINDIEIIVRESVLHGNRPYYQIKYKEVGNNYYNFGFGSFYLENVIKWRKEEFEVVDEEIKNKEEVKEIKETMEENKVLEQLKKIEKKQDALMDSVAVILNYLMMKSAQEKPNSDYGKEELTSRILCFVMCRDELVELVHGKGCLKGMEIKEDFLKEFIDSIDK